MNAEMFKGYRPDDLMCEIVKNSLIQQLVQSNENLEQTFEMEAKEKHRSNRNQRNQSAIDSKINCQLLPSHILSFQMKCDKF